MCADNWLPFVVLENALSTKTERPFSVYTFNYLDWERRCTTYTFSHIPWMFATSRTIQKMFKLKIRKQTKQEMFQKQQCPSKWNFLVFLTEKNENRETS